jgi:hypothetical protein
MSIAGKILAVFNVLAALAAFIYFLPTAWGTRQSWAYAYYRHELILDGLPLDKDEKDTEGHALVDKMSDTTRRQLFQSAGTPVSTQMEEIERVRNELRNADPARLTEISANMARTGPEREEAKANEDPLTAIFQEVDKAKDPAGQRAAIARVLFNAYDDQQKEKRLPVIIGLREFALEVNLEADAVVAMTARVRRGMQRDLASFEASYPQLIKDIQVIAEKIEDTKKQLEVQEQLSKSHNSLVMKRTSDVAEIKKSIFEAKQATRRAMEALANEQKLLHQAEAEVGKRAKENEDLEKEIRRKEGVASSKEK